MKVGIIGAGMIGGTLGPLWLKAGHEVCYGTRHPEQVNIPGAGSKTTEETAQWSEVLLIAIPLGATEGLAKTIGPWTKDMLVMDAGNVIPSREPAVAAAISASGRGSGVWVAQCFAEAHVVKAFNTVNFKTLQSQAGRKTEPLGIPLAGDDPRALAVAEGLVRDAGFEPVVVGVLSEAKHFDVGTPVWNTGASASALRKHFSLPQA
jgi:predicted dinucleotide-binding enzyme